MDGTDHGATDWSSSPERMKSRRSTRVVAGVLLATLFAFVPLFHLVVPDEDDLKPLRDSQIRLGETFSDALEWRDDRGGDLLDAERRQRIVAESPISATDEALSVAREQIEAAMSAVDLADIRLERSLKAKQDADAAVARQEQRIDERSEWIAVLASSLFIILLIAGVYREWYATGQRLAYEERRTRERMMTTDVAFIDGHEPLSHSTIWAKNVKNVDAYHGMVMRYAKASRTMTGTALVVGLVFIVFAAIAALSVRSTASSIAASLIAATGAALTGYIARVVLRNSEASSTEVQAFFSHVLRVEGVLSAERLAASLPPEHETAAKLMIIESLVGRAAPGESVKPPD